METSNQINFKILFSRYILDKVFKSRLSKFCGKQSLKNLLSPLLNTLCHILHEMHDLFPILVKKRQNSALNRKNKTDKKQTLHWGGQKFANKKLPVIMCF